MSDPEVLSKDQCTKILKNILKSDNFTISNYATELMAEQYEGLIGEQYKLYIDYIYDDKKISQRFFVKILNGVNFVMFEISKSIRAFDKESTYYEIFIPSFKNEGIDVSFLPKCYLCESYTIVLEDLSVTSYKGVPKSKGLSYDHCKKALQLVAKFHASAIIYEEKISKKLGRKYRISDEYGDILADRVCTEESTEGSRYIWCSYKGILQYCHYTCLLENGPKKILFLQKFADEMDKIFSPNKNNEVDFRKTILHRDLWSSNFLFKYNENNEIIDSKLVDFQTITTGSPARDVMQLIFTNTGKDFRKRHIDDLLEHYYKHFNEFLVEAGVEITDDLSEVRFLESCEENKIFAKIWALFDRSLTGISDMDFVKAAETEESFRSFLFEDRGQSMIDAQENNEEYRELMTEDIVELAEMLCSK